MKRHLKRLIIFTGLLVLVAGAFGYVFAQGQNDDPECEPGEETCGPYTCSTGSVDKPGTMNPTSKKICIGDSAAPTVSGTTFKKGKKTRTCTDGCTEWPDGADISYSPEYRWDPEIPATFDTCGEKSFKCYVKGVTEDTNCPDPTPEVLVDTFTVTVVAVDSLTQDIPSGQGGLEAGSDPPTYWVCPCPGDVIVTASSCPTLTADQLPDCWTFTGGVTIDKLHHKVDKAALKDGPVTFTVTCGTSTKTIVLKTDEEDASYGATGGGATCDCDDWTAPHPFHDKCGNSLAVDCVGSVRGVVYGNCLTPGHFEYRYNGIWVGTCLYNGGMNSFLFKTTKHNCRILRTWHLTQRPTTPTKWTVTKYDCMTGSGPSQNCRTKSTWDDAWGNPADDLTQPGYPANSCENQGDSCP